MANLISFNQDVAKILGIPEAIILKEIAHWVGKKGKSDAHNTFDGLRYTYNSIPELTEKFTCLSEHTIRRALQSLKDKELLLCRSRGRFHDKKGIKWSNSYTINLPVYEALFSSLLEVTPVQNGQVKQNARIPVQNGQVKTEYQSKLDGLNQATTNTNTTNSSSKEKLEEELNLELIVGNNGNITHPTPTPYVSHTQCETPARASTLPPYPDKVNQLLKIWEDQTGRQEKLKPDTVETIINAIEEDGLRGVLISLGNTDKYSHPERRRLNTIFESRQSYLNKAKYYK